MEARSNEYAFDSKVRMSAVGSTGRMRLASIVDYFQDCTVFQSEGFGVGVKYAEEKGRAWILSYWQIEVKEYPEVCTDIRVHTWATSFKGMFGDRNFYMEDHEGEMLARAHSLWVYMDMKTGRPVRPFEEEIAPYGSGEPLDMELESRKITLPEAAEERSHFQVRRYHIDTNNHMNNCQYIRLAMELLEEDFEPRKIRVEYKKSAMYGDIIVPKIAVEETRTVVELCDIQGGLYAVCEFK